MSIVIFDSEAETLAKFNPMNGDNKADYKGIISGLATRGSTNLLKAIQESLSQIQKRQFVNEFSAVFILSDGQDTCGNNLDQIITAMKKVDKAIKSEYQIHSFGYGDDHDEKVLSAMRNFKNGKFYYIERDDMVDECFIDCMGNLLTVIGQNVTI